MRGLTILSPHLDDAAFSLAFSLAKWQALAIPVTVVNFFTESAYAPYQITRGSVSSLRRREDKLALAKISKNIRVEYLGLLDAPLRLSVATELVSGPKAVNVHLPDVAYVAARSARYVHGACVLAPLGLGNHVDHRTVRDAMIESSKPSLVGFYEDLPYATWTPEHDIHRQVQDIGSQLRTSLVPKIVCGRMGLQWKRRVAESYRTQIRPPDAEAIARFGAKYRKGERIWIPGHSRPWLEMLRDAR